MEDTELSGDIVVPEKESPSFKKSVMSLQLSNIQFRELFKKSRESVQPWADFLNFSKFKAPKSVAPVGKRVVKNVERFQGNYIFVFIGLVVFCILTSPMLLIAIAAVAGACYIISIKNQDKKITLMGRELSLAQQYTGVGILSLPVFWLAGAGSVIFWLIGASVVVILLHASMYKLEDESDGTDLQMESVVIG